MTEYQPNFNDPRVVSRVKKALGFVCGIMSDSKPREWSTRYIDKHFGQQTTDISKYLRKTLLIVTDDFVRFNSSNNKCKEYIRNEEGVRYLKEKLKLSNTLIYPIVYDLAQEDHKDELSSGNFEYSDKSNRLWHPLQRYRKQFRTSILSDAGYLHDYDIECCAPTLIHQYAQQLGMDEYLFALRKYLTDKTTIRQEIAKDIELPIEAVKEIINALFAGAPLSNNKHSDIYDILNGDHARIEFLKQHPYLIELREDIKTCWTYITPHLSRRRNTKTNRLIKITCKQKWNVYFELERCVLDSIRTYLDNNSIRYFLIHDGWTCDREIDRDELRDYVRDKTRYEIKFEHTKLAIH